ncbi:unnamed protein product, partial [Prunus brigantina]
CASTVQISFTSSKGFHWRTVQDCGEIACFVKLKEYWLNPTAKDLTETTKLWKNSGKSMINTLICLLKTTSI